MPCYKPLAAYRQPAGEAGGKSTIVFGRQHLQNYDVAKPLDLPCGQCIGCRLERSRRWAVRIMHEAQMHERSSFLTLTYDEESVPGDKGLCVEHFQKFMKKLRKQSAQKLRFFHCGEYGEETGRPHYHACLFGEDFANDRVPYRKTARGDVLFNSPTLSRIWGHGHAVIGELTFESAAYVARYCLKKITGEGAEEHYGGRKPEYVTMSRRPGIGAGWFSKYRAEAYPSDSVVMRAREMLPPPYYDLLLEKADPDLYARVKRERSRTAKLLGESEDSRSRRLMDRETVKKETIKNTLRRSV